MKEENIKLDREMKILFIDILKSGEINSEQKRQLQWISAMRVEEITKELTEIIKASRRLN